MSGGRAFLRLLLSLAIAALLLGDVWRGVHLLQARHVLCPEHGELVDAEEAEMAAGAASGHIEALPDSGAGHHHDHCSVAAAPSRLSHAVIAPAAVRVEACAATIASAPSRARLPSSRGVLAYAPKQSPPAPSPAA
jgi:hypothetical protein